MGAPGKAGGLAALEASAAPVRKASRPSLPASGYTGRYRDAWYGPIAIDEQGGRLRIDFLQTPGMVGSLRHWQYDTFRADWDDASIEPAFVSFSLDADGQVVQVPALTSLTGVDRVSVNSAAAEQLQSLPGVGPAIAQRKFASPAYSWARYSATRRPV